MIDYFYKHPLESRSKIAHDFGINKSTLLQQLNGACKSRAKGLLPVLLELVPVPARAQAYSESSSTMRSYTTSSINHCYGLTARKVEGAGNQSPCFCWRIFRQFAFLSESNIESNIESNKTALITESVNSPVISPVPVISSVTHWRELFGHVNSVFRHKAYYKDGNLLPIPHRKHTNAKHAL